MLTTMQSMLEILGAFYGTSDVTMIVKSKQSPSALNIIANNATFGDPMPGVLKNLVVYYRYTNCKICV